MIAAVLRLKTGDIMSAAVSSAETMVVNTASKITIPAAYFSEWDSATVNIGISPPLFLTASVIIANNVAITTPEHIPAVAIVFLSAFLPKRTIIPIDRTIFIAE